MRRLVNVGVALLLLSAATAQAYTRISSGLEAYTAGNYLLASELWRNDAEAVATASVSAYDQKVAALAYVLASMSAARAKTSSTYDYWGKANSIYAKLGIEWKSEANQFRDYIGQLEQSAAAFSNQDAAGSLSMDAADAQLLNLQGTGIFNFERPPSGLIEASARTEDQEAAKLGANPLSLRNVSRLANRTPNLDQNYTSNNSSSEETSTNPQGFSNRMDPAFNLTPTELEPLDDKDINIQPLRTQEHAISNRGNIAYNQELSDEQLEWARIAWQYYRNSIQSVTGLADTHPGYAFTSVWGLANQIAATVSANQLNIVTDIEANEILSSQFVTLLELPLYNDQLPNRTYTTDTAEMISANGKPNPIGSGWSAVDIGRLLIWLKIVVEYYPDFTNQITKIVNQWDLQAAISDSGLVGALQNPKTSKTFQEGRFGYEHYAAKGFGLWGIAVPAALDYKNTKSVDILDIDVLIDDRSNSPSNGYPFLLIATELGGWDKTIASTIINVSKVHTQYWNTTGNLVALAGYHLDKPPWYGYGTFSESSNDWVSVAFNGTVLQSNQGSSFTTKGAFMLANLSTGEHADKLRLQASRLLKPNTGFHEGIYDDGSLNKTISADTQAAILESLWFANRSNVPFLQYGSEEYNFQQNSETNSRPALSIRRY